MPADTPINETLNPTYDPMSFHDAGYAVYFAHKSLMESTTLWQQAEALRALQEAMHDFESWLPGYNWHNGELYPPKESGYAREDD